jgi:hypothetical protein
MKFSAHTELSGVTVLEPMILNEPTTTVLVAVAVFVAVLVLVTVVVVLVPQPVTNKAAVRTRARGNNHFCTDLNNFFSFFILYFFLQSEPYKRHNSFISFITLFLMSSLIRLTSSIGCPSGSASCQSSMETKTAGHTFSALQPIVKTRSASSIICGVNNFGTLRLTSRPTSRIASTTVGLILEAGCVPAEEAEALSPAMLLKKASAIWLRPELWTHTKSTRFLAIYL